LKKAVMTVLEAAAIFLLAMYLLRLAICWLSEMWWVILIIVVVGIVIAVGYRVWKNKSRY